MNFSKITLGTVQLGLDYSINSSKPGLSESYDMLSVAREVGINVIDTARTYGCSEETIGSYLKGNSAFSVVTKFKINPSNLNDPEDAFEEALRSVEQSLRALGIDQIPVLLFHKGPEHSLLQSCKVIPGILRRLREIGLIKMGGISVFEPFEIIPLCESDEIKVFQVPVNIFDHRMLQKEILTLIGSEEKIIFARSIFLKGLFFKQPETLTGKMDMAIPYLEKLNHLAQKYQISVAEMAFLFIRDIQAITSMVIGADCPGQVRQNARMLKLPRLPDALFSDIQRNFFSIPGEVITPHLWNL